MAGKPGPYKCRHCGDEDIRNSRSSKSCHGCYNDRQEARKEARRADHSSLHVPEEPPRFDPIMSNNWMQRRIV